MSVIFEDGGFRMEGERAEDRNADFHKRIVSAEPIQNTRTGMNCTLECGHRIQTFGDIRRIGGVALCMQCRDGAK